MKVYVRDAHVESRIHIATSVTKAFQDELYATTIPGNGTRISPDGSTRSVVKGPTEEDQFSTRRPMRGKS